MVVKKGQFRDNNCYQELCVDFGQNFGRSLSKVSVRRRYILTDAFVVLLSHSKPLSAAHFLVVHLSLIIRESDDLFYGQTSASLNKYMCTNG